MEDNFKQLSDQLVELEHSSKFEAKYGSDKVEVDWLARRGQADIVLRVPSATT